MDGKEVGSLEIGAELALRDQVKWKYRGSAEIVFKGLTKGKHSITISSTDLDNETDKILLYQVSDGKTGPVDQVTYPASDMRLENGTTLTWDGNGNNGFANLNGGTVDVFAHAWEAGYQDVTVAYNASMGAQIALSINGQAARTITAPRNGLQTSTVRVAMSEGINRLELSGAAGILLKNVTTARAGDGDANAVKVEAEDMKREGRQIAAAQLQQYGLYGLTDEQLDGFAAKLLEDEKQRQHLYERALDNKVFDVIRENVKLEEQEISMADFEKLFQK